MKVPVQLSLPTYIVEHSREVAPGVELLQRQVLVLGYIHAHAHTYIS